MKALIVEDNTTLLESLGLAFHSEGFAVDTCDNGDDALYRALNQSYDIMVLDVNLPGTSGFDIAKDVRSHDIGTPILFLTARDSIGDKLTGFDIGGDDYLVKPFDLQELFARVHALIKRASPMSGSRLEFKDIAVMARRGVASVGDKPLDLTSKEFQILEYLLINKGCIVSHDQMASRLWDAEHAAESNAIGVHVHNLRKKLLGAGSAASIKTVRGLGLTLE